MPWEVCNWGKFPVTIYQGSDCLKKGVGYRNRHKIVYIKRSGAKKLMENYERNK